MAHADSFSSRGFNPNSGAPLIRFMILGRTFMGILDTCCQFSLAGRQLVKHLKFNNHSTILTPTRDAKPLSQSNPDAEITKREEAWVYISWSTGTVRTRLIYVPELRSDLILGRDFMINSRISINFSRNGYEYDWNPGNVYPFEKETNNSFIPLSCWKLFYIHFDPPPPRKAKTQNNSQDFKCSETKVMVVTPYKNDSKGILQCHGRADGASLYDNDEDINLNEEVQRSSNYTQKQEEETQLEQQQSSSFEDKEKQEKLLREESKKLLQEFDRFNELMNSHLVSDYKKWQLKEFCLELLKKYREIQRDLSKN